MPNKDTKKEATKGTTRRQTIKQRAQAIIADVKGYDADTRTAIKNALEHKAADLAVLVSRAEAGDIVLDCATDDFEIEIERIADEHGDTGTAAMNFYFTRDSLPTFLRHETAAAINRAAVALHLPLPSEVEMDSVEEFRRLLAVFEAAGDDFILTDETGGAR